MTKAKRKGNKKKMVGEKKMCDTCFVTHASSSTICNRMCGKNNCTGRLYRNIELMNQDLFRKGRTQAPQRCINVFDATQPNTATMMTVAGRNSTAVSPNESSVTSIGLNSSPAESNGTALKKNATSIRSIGCPKKQIGLGPAESNRTAMKKRATLIGLNTSPKKRMAAPDSESNGRSASSTSTSSISTQKNVSSTMEWNESESIVTGGNGTIRTSSSTSNRRRRSTSTSRPNNKKQKANTAFSDSEDTDDDSFLLNSKRTFAKKTPPPLPQQALGAAGKISASSSTGTGARSPVTQGTTTTGTMMSSPSAGKTNTSSRVGSLSTAARRTIPSSTSSTTISCTESKERVVSASLNGSTRMKNASLTVSGVPVSNVWKSDTPKRRTASSSTSSAFGKENSDIVINLLSDDGEDSVTNAYKTPNHLNGSKDFSVSTRKHPTESGRDGYWDPTQLHKDNIHFMTDSTASWPIRPSSSIPQEDTETPNSDSAVLVLPKKDPTKCCCDDALAVIRLAQRHLPIRLQHTSCSNRDEAIQVPASRINEYNLFITTVPIPTLIPKEKGYLLCPGMKSMVDRGLKKRDREAAAAANTNAAIPGNGGGGGTNNTNNNMAAARPDLPGRGVVVSGIILPINQETSLAAAEIAAAEIAAANDTGSISHTKSKEHTMMNETNSNPSKTLLQNFGFNTVSPWTTKMDTQSKKRCRIQVNYNTQQINLGNTTKHTLNTEDCQGKIKCLKQLWNCLFIYMGNGKYEVNRQALYQPTNEMAIEQCNAANLFLNSRTYRTNLKNAKQLDQSRNLKVRNTGKKFDEKKPVTQASVTDHDKEVKNVRFRRQVLNITGPLAEDGRDKKEDCVPFRQFDQQVKVGTICKIPSEICRYQNKTQGTTTNGVHAVLAESIDTSLNRVGRRSKVYYLDKDGILYAETTLLFENPPKEDSLFHNFCNELEFWYDHCEVMGQFDNGFGRTITVLRIIQQRYGSIGPDGRVVYALSDRSNTSIQVNFKGHQLFGWTFLDGPPNWKEELAKGPEEYAKFLELWIVDHENGMRHHNYKENLRWLLQSDNIKPENCGNGNFKYETRYNIDPIITKAQAKKECIHLHPVHKEIGINNDGSVYYDHQQNTFLTLTETKLTLGTYINRTIRINGCHVQASHFSYECHNNTTIPKDQDIIIDHDNGERRDQSKSNLVLSDFRENPKNHKVYSNNKSGTTGVSSRRTNGKYQVSYRKEGTDGIKRSANKQFCCEEEAIEFRQTFEKDWGITIRKK